MSIVQQSGTSGSDTTWAVQATFGDGTGLAATSDITARTITSQQVNSVEVSAPAAIDVNGTPITF